MSLNTDLLLLNAYSSFISGVFITGLGIFVFSKGPKKKLNKIFLLFCISVVTWLFSTSGIYISKTDIWRIFWDRMVYVGVVFIPTTLYHFLTVFCETEKENKKKIYLGYFLSFVFLILSRTDYFVAGLYRYEWGWHTRAKIFHHIFLLFFLFSIYLYGKEINNSLKERKKIKNIKKIRQIGYLFTAIIIMLAGTYAFLSAYGIDINPIVAYWLQIIAGVIYVLAILKYHLFGIRVILTELLVGAMGIILAVLLFLMPTSGLRTLVGIVLVLFLIFGYLLIKYTYEQERRREIAEEIAAKERKLRQKAERIARELRHLNQIRNQMFLTGQHHTRTPLSNIKNFASVLLTGGYGPINKEQKHALEVIMSQANESIELANLYLSVSQLEAGRAFLEKEKTDICQLIKEQIEKLKIEAQTKGVEIVTQFEKGIPLVEVDKSQLGLSVFAIIDNAIKYSPRGKGKVEVSVKKKDQNRILLSFKDNGIGIAKENIDYIGRFAFQRTERAKRVHGTGKGLALYFANLVVKEHKGKLWVESEGPNKGATFYIELPVKQPRKV